MHKELPIKSLGGGGGGGGAGGVEVGDINNLRYADNPALFADSDVKLGEIINKETKQSENLELCIVR